MGWWITLGVLILLSCLPLGIHLAFDAGGFSVGVIVSFFRLTVYPRKPKKPKKPKKEKPKKEKKIQEEKPAPKPKQGGSLLRFLPLVKEVLNFFGDFHRKLRVNCFLLHLTLAGDDPCDTAINYTRAWAAIGNLQPALNRAFIIRKQDIGVACDFLGEETKIEFAMDVTITLGRLLGLGFRYAVRFLRTLLAIRKAGQNTKGQVSA